MPFPTHNYWPNLEVWKGIGEADFVKTREGMASKYATIIHIVIRPLI
jgi:hypothetical protein